MVQKFQSPVRIYKYPFELVMAAYERRFPRCPQMPIVLDCQVIKDEQADDGSKRETSRRCRLAVDAPYLFKKIIGVDVVYFMQTNYLDWKARTLSIEAINETFSSRIEIFERCRYYAHPDNPDWTCFDQTAQLDIKNFFGFENSMEKMGMKQYTQTTLKGKEIIEYFIAELKTEGITHIDRWKPIGIEKKTDENTVDRDDECKEVEKVHNYYNDENNKSFSSSDVILDADYIDKYLGQLSPMQESKLLEFHKRLIEYDCPNIPNYTTLLRFLRARDFNTEKSILMLNESLKWREENQVDRLLYEYHTPYVILKHFPGGWHHYDKDGRPLYILRLGHMDVKGLLKSVGEDGLLKLTLHVCEEGIKLMENSTSHHNKPIHNWSLLVDLEGLSMRHLWRPGIKALLRIIETVEKNYPETMGRVLVVRAPRVFPILWTLVSTFIDENTRSKFLFYGGPDCLTSESSLEEYIPIDFIPDFLGGNSKTLIHEGGIVPKSFYKNSPDDDPTGKTALDEQSLYHCIDLKPGQIHEILIKNNDPKSVLTWDFDVFKNDVQFSVYRTNMELLMKKDEQFSSYFEGKDFEEGGNYFKVEPLLVCRHKESVQGSHVMNFAASYVIQWICPPTCDGPAQIMFYYEILSSAKYKGSMTSLQSGFSVLSIASSCQSR